MKKVFSSVLTQLMAAAIVANVALLWQLNGRVTALEVKVSALVKQTATQTAHETKNEIPSLAQRD